MKRHGNWVVKLLLILMAALWLSVVAASWSEAAPVEDSDSEYNFSWLDPDKKVSVLQNRRYRKAGRPMVSAAFGLANSNAYRKSYAIDPRISYFWSESFGIEVFYTAFSNKENDLYTAINGTGVRPDVIEVKNQVGAQLLWAPWYAKINVFNTVLHFDWYFSGGVGTMNANMVPGSNSATTLGLAATTKSMTGFYLGTGHLFHVSDNFDVRLDFRNAWFKAPQRAVTGNEIWFNSTAFTIGAGLKL
jgi:outer membrane beta-barrel protein